MITRIAAILVLLTTVVILGIDPSLQNGGTAAIAAIAWIAAEANHHYKEEKNYKNSHSEEKTRIISFKVTKSKGCLIETEVWYYYDGSLGADGIHMHVSARDGNKRNLSGGGSHSDSEIRVVGHRAKMNIRMEYRPFSGGNNHCKYLAITMSKLGDTIEERFEKFDRIWNT